MCKQPRLLSEEKPIPQKKFDDLPADWWKQGKEGRRKISHEEVLRDLEKSAEQLLIDTHDESLNLSRNLGESILRTLARMASMQLKIEKSQKWTTRWVIVLAVISALFGGWQVYIGYRSLKLAENSSSNRPSSIDIPSIASQGVLVPIAPIEPLRLQINLRTDEK